MRAKPQTITCVQLNRAEYFVPLTVKIPGSELALARKRGADRALIDFIAEVKDAYGLTVTNLRDKVDIKLSDQTAAELARRPIEYDAGFTLLPGSYRIKFLARDGETGRIGSYEMPFTIPNLGNNILDNSIHLADNLTYGCRVGSHSCLDCQKRHGSGDSSCRFKRTSMTVAAKASLAT